MAARPAKVYLNPASQKITARNVPIKAPATMVGEVNPVVTVFLKDCILFVHRRCPKLKKKPIPVRKLKLKQRLLKMQLKLHN